MSFLGAIPFPRWVLWALAGFCLIIIGEIAARVWLGGRTLSPAIFEVSSSPAGYQLTPNQSTSVHIFDRNIEITTTQNRTRLTVRAQQEAAIARVHIVGDSQAFGWGLSDEETIASRLQQKLGSSFAVINHGIPGYGPLDYLFRIKQLPVQDQVIVLQVEENDLWDTYGIFRNATTDCGYLTTLRIWGVPLPCILLNARLVQLVIDRYNKFRYKTRPTPIGFQEQSQVAGETLSFRLHSLYREAKKRRGRNLIFAVVPWMPRFVPGEVSNYFPPPLGIPRSDLFPDECDISSVFTSQEAPELLYIRGDSHLSLLGADVVADVLATKIRAPGPSGKTR